LQNPFMTVLAPAELDALPRACRDQRQTDTALRSSTERQRYAAALAEASSTASIPTIGLSRASWSAGGRPR
jgi:hypothetical protein